LYPHGDAHHQIADALEVGRRLQAGKQLPGARFVDPGDGRWQALVDLAFNQVEFFLAILDREEGHAGRIGKQVANVERGVAGNQAGFQREAGKIIRPSQLLLSRF